jgi:hypothetical protein
MKSVEKNMSMWRYICYLSVIVMSLFGLIILLSC